MTALIIGCGSAGRRHLACLPDTVRDVRLWDPAIDLSQLTSAGPAAESLRLRRWVAPKWTPVPSDALSADVVLTADVDVAIVASPAETHAAFVAALVERRIPFLLEKPAALRADDLPEGVTVPHLVACNLRMRHEVIGLTGFVRAQAGAVIGGLVVQTDIARWPGTSYRHELFECCHEIDLALWWLAGNAPDRSVSLVDVDRKFNRWRLDLRRDDGAGGIVVTIDAHHKGASQRVGWVEAQGCRLGYTWSRTPDDVDEMYRAQMRHFFQVVEGKADSINTLDQARRVVEICEQAVGAAA